MNTQREMFEAWADKSVGKEYDIDGNPNYTLISLRTVMWETWQAAAAAQPAVPDERRSDYSSDYAQGCVDGWNNCREAMLAPTVCAVQQEPNK